MVLPDRIELSTSPLPRECSTTELRQQGAAGAPPEARGNCHKGWQGARKVPGDPAGRLGRPRHIAPTPLRRARMMRSARWSMVDATAELPLPRAEEGRGGGRGGATRSGRLKNLDISPSQPTPVSRAGGGLRPGSTPKA